MNITMFIVGNLVADTAIGIFAFAVWWHEYQNMRLRRILALATSSNLLTDRQVLLVESYTIIGDKQALLKVLNGRVERIYAEKLTSLLSAFLVLRTSTPILVVCFAIGILLEAMALMM